ncbi:hypothetical protein ACPWSR_05490 [Alloiococcus sp. CFN-8]|uniref:hypothetical protein n=1 Tax=Alloiococcus sp. CFN-8 TaxID=3416081 RepID=UPI003CED5094
MYIDKKKKTSPLLILLLFLMIATSIFYTSTGIDKTNSLKKTEGKGEKNSISIEAIEIYKFNPNKEASIIDHWYFRDASSLELIKSILKKEATKTNTVPPIKAEYKIILSYSNKEIDSYTLWLEENSENAVFEREDYNLISKAGTKKLKALMIYP